MSEAIKTATSEAIKTVVVTGANGFTGGPVCAALLKRGYRVIAAVRPGRAAPPGTEPRFIGDLGPDTDWSGVVEGADAVVHLAARVHQMTETAADPLALYRRINRDGTVRLAAQAVAAGAKRFIFVSSITVNGEGTSADRPYRADDEPDPKTPYAVSKREAEEALAVMAAMTGLELTVLRPPLIVGPGAKANLELLMGLVRRGIPLPVGAIRNRRSMLSVANLACAVAFCLECPGTVGQTYLLKDDKDLSVPELIVRLGELMGKPAVLVPVPVWMLKLGGRILGRSDMIRRITGSLWVDDGPLRALGWAPPHSLDDGLRTMILT